MTLLVDSINVMALASAHRSPANKFVRMDRPFFDKSLSLYVSTIEETCRQLE